MRFWADLNLVTSKVMVFTPNQPVNFVKKNFRNAKPQKFPDPTLDGASPGATLRLCKEQLETQSKVEEVMECPVKTVPNPPSEISGFFLAILRRSS